MTRVERLMLAFSGDKTRETVSSALESGGMVVRACVKTGAEVLRQVRFMGGGIVVCAYKLPDMTAVQLCADLEGEAFMLVLGTPQQLLDMEGERAFTLPTPFSRGELLAAVRMIRQMEEKLLLRLLPEKKEEETRLIAQAKKILMKRDGADEAQAHKTLQRLSMESGVKVVVIARRILSNAVGTAAETPSGAHD